MTAPRDALARVVLSALWEQDRRVEACLMGKSYREDDAYTAADALLESDWLAEQRGNAWDEGAAVGAAYGMDAIALNPLHANPYRTGETS